MRAKRAILFAVSAIFSLALAACESSNVLDKIQDTVSGLDPFGTSDKPLPGQRKPLFPEGIPGVQQGIPQELMAGNRAQQAQEQPTGSVEPSLPARNREAARSQEPQTKSRPKTAAQTKPPLRPATRPESRTSQPPEDAVWPPPPASASSTPPAAPASSPASSPWPSPNQPPPPPAWPTPR
jgi:hypothetical protein